MTGEAIGEHGDPAGSRTQNTRLKRPVLCQLSYQVEGWSLAQLEYSRQEQMCPLRSYHNLDAEVKPRAVFDGRWEITGIGGEEAREIVRHDR